jgi:hypothetical protein
MENKPKVYREFIDILCYADDVYEYSQVDLENFEESAKLHEKYNSPEVAYLYETLGPIFNSLSPEQKDAWGKWNAFLFRNGIQRCLEGIDIENQLFLGIEKADGGFEKLPFKYEEDFEKRCKVEGYPVGEWE